MHDTEETLQFSVWEVVTIFNHKPILPENPADSFEIKVLVLPARIL